MESNELVCFECSGPVGITQQYGWGGSMYVVLTCKRCGQVWNGTLKKIPQESDEFEVYGEDF